jgi:hypothetical protein
MVSRGAAASSEFYLRGAGLLLCADPNGEVNLSSTEPGAWESFCFAPGKTI